MPCVAGPAAVSSKNNLLLLPAFVLGSGVPTLGLLSLSLPLFISARLIMLLEKSAWLPSGAWFNGVGSAWFRFCASGCSDLRD